MKRQRDCTQAKSIQQSNMTSIIHEMSKQNNRDEIQNLHQVINEAEKNKAQNELLETKKRLADLEESKHGLANEVQHLKDQLNKFDSTSQFSIRNNESLNIPLRLEKEIEHLRLELARSKEPKETNHQSVDVLRAIEKYEKQKDFLADHNQALKVLLKEKVILLNLLKKLMSLCQKHIKME